MAQPQPQFQQNSPSGQNQQQYNSSSLKGSTVRVITGGVIIVMGVFEILWAIVLLAVPRSYCVAEYLGWGIWGGVFAIVTGSFGIASMRHKCMVIVYMILAIIASVIGGGGVISSAVAANCVGSSKYYYSYHYNYYGNGNVHQYKAHLAFYILLAVTCAIQSLAAIIGASFTCVAVCPGSNNQPQQMIVYQPTQPPHQPINTQASYPAVITTNDKHFTNKYAEHKPLPEMAQPQPQFQQNSPSGQNQQQYYNPALKGSTVRVITGCAIIVMGVFEIIWAIVLLAVPLYYCNVEYLGWGIWGGVVIVYMILAIIASVIGGGGLISSAVAANCVGSLKNGYYYYYDDGNVHQANTHLAFYILLAVTCAIQSLAAIIGASFTCVAVCPGSNNQPQQMIVYQPTQLPHQPINTQAHYPAVIITNGQPIPYTSNIQGVPPSYNYAVNNQHVVNAN
ncbi:uncharacterized protein [Apostichopus japonicus]|uniref:uncharacterized protein isoform X2 n=1 Tax=Stichopus japonicus TaxID=307972 RepID=UPI003AB116A9